CLTCGRNWLRLDVRRRVCGLLDRHASLARLDEEASPGLSQHDGARFCHFLHEVAEAARAVVALRERRVELQQRALEQPELWRDLAFGQHLQRPFDERQRLLDRTGGNGTRSPLDAPSAAAAHEVLVRDELVAVPL